MGGNLACAASRLGLRVGMVSWVGDDADGQFVLADLRRFGVDTTHVVVKSNTNTSYTTVLLDASGEKAIIIVPTSFDVLDLTSTLITYLGQAHLIYAPAYDLKQLEQVAEIVHAAGGLICTDVEPAAGLQGDTLALVLSLVDIAFFKADTQDPKTYAQELRAAGPQLVVLTLGAQGALACSTQELVYCPAFTVPVVDTTGAGDCFMAAFLAAHLRHFPLAQALRYAHAAAALSIQDYGARSALPNEAQVQAFLTAHDPSTGPIFDK